MQLIANAKQQFIDKNGLPLAGGTVGFYYPGTTNPKPTYQDSGATIANTNPISLDSNGQAIIWGSGTYRQIVKDASGVTIWDQLTQDANAGLTGSVRDARYVAGTDYTPGTTATLTLPIDPGSSSNMWVFFDSAFQASDQFSVSGTIITFASPIPVGVQEVTIKIGTTIAIGTPGAGSVGDSQLAWGNVLFRCVDSISQLAALPPGIYTRVFALGYYAAQDGGGGSYVYSASTPQSTANGGTIIAALGGKGCWLLQHTGPVSVKQFGAKGDNTNDDAPAIQACIMACPDTWIPDGTYLFNSTNAAPVPVTDPINVLIQSKNNFSIRCSPNAVFVCSNTANYSCMFGFWKCQNFVFDGPTLQGNRTGIAAGSETVGINLMSVVNFQIKNVHLSGNWGDSGTAFGGDWWSGGLIQNVVMDQIGQGFDVAFMQNVVFENIDIHGYSIATGGAGNIGFNTSYDIPLLSYNSTGISFLGGNTNHLYFKNFRVSGMNTGVLLQTGSYIYFDEHCNFNNNQGTPTGTVVGGYGVVITYNNGGSFSSVGYPVNNVFFDGTKFENNGLAAGGAGVMVSAAAVTNSDLISNIVFRCCNFYNNGPTGLVTTGEAHMSGIVVQDCFFKSGGSQANAVVSTLVSAGNTNGLPNNAKFSNNYGVNPYGYFVPTLPGGTGSANTIYNTYAFPVDVYIASNPSAYSPVIVQPSGAGTITLGAVAAGSGAQVYTLPPGGGIYFNTAVPGAWTWMGH